MGATRHPSSFADDGEIRQRSLPGRLACMLGVTLSLSTTGCSVLFMERLPENFDVRTEEPRCTSSAGFVAWDFAIAAADLAVMAVVAKNGSDSDFQDKNALLVVAGAEGFLHLISGGIGTSWVGECEAARQKRDAYVKGLSKPRFFTGRPRRTIRTIVKVPRGFYCATEACAREKSACEQFRIIASDPQPCALVESAFCFGAASTSICSRSLEGCQRQWQFSRSTENTCTREGEPESKVDESLEGNATPEAPAPAPAPEVPAVEAVSPEPNGYYCSSAICARAESTCQRASAGDPQGCQHREVAYCFPLNEMQICRPTMESCQEQREAAGVDAGADCAESK